MKPCLNCGVQMTKKPKEAYWQFETRKFCSFKCNGRYNNPRLDSVDVKARYRTVKVNGKQRLEHRHVVEQAIGRPLARSEHVHHINHNKHDNRLENLEVVSPAEHGRRHTWRPIAKDCTVCGAEYVPHKTKRARSKTCGAKECIAQRVWLSRRVNPKPPPEACVNGHQFTPESTGVRGGRRYCRTCASEAGRRYRAKKAAVRSFTEDFVGAAS